MARSYTVSFQAVNTTAAVDVFEITPASNKICQVYGLFISQSSDYGDAQAEGLGYRVIRGHTTSGSGGTATTPRPVGRGEVAASFTAETCNTTAASAGTTVDLHAAALNVQVGEALWLPEGSEWEVGQGDTTLVIRLTGAPTDQLTLFGTLYIREQG